MIFIRCNFEMVGNKTKQSGNKSNGRPLDKALNEPEKSIDHNNESAIIKNNPTGNNSVASVLKFL
jgi:hypothetical protein